MYTATVYRFFQLLVERPATRQRCGLIEFRLFETETVREPSTGGKLYNSEDLVSNKQMLRSFEISGDSFKHVLYASQLTVLLLSLLFVVFPFEDSASFLSASLIVVLVTTGLVGLWRMKTTDDGGTSLGTAEDITYDPFADPGDMAKDRWKKAIRRLPGGDDEQD